MGALVSFVISLLSGYIISNVHGVFNRTGTDLLGIQLHITERKDLCHDLQNSSMSGDATGKFDSSSLDKGKLADLLIQTDLFGGLRRPFLDGNVSVKA